jgi:hypothetical protein
MRTVRALTAAFALALAACTAGGQPLAPPDAHGAFTSAGAARAALGMETPMKADAFVDSIGVNTHLTQDLTADREYATIVRRMRELGVRHVRDGIFPSQTRAQYRDERNFFAATGATMLALIDCPKPLGYFPGAQTPPPVVRAFDAEVGNVIDYLEGPNEPDLRRVKGWAALTRTCIAGDDRGQALPVPFVAPAMGNPLHAATLGDISALVDVGGIHRYFSAHEPGTKGFGRGGACGRWEAMSWNICEARVNAGPTAPLFVTETGYTTFGEIDPKTDGKYISRVLFADSLAGIARTYIYELHDDGTDPSNSEDGYGLIDYGGKPKPAFNAVRAIVGLLRDPGPAFSPSPLQYAVAGPATVLHELFQKRNGTYVVAIWNEVPSWDIARAREMPVAPRRVTLTFAAAPSNVAYRALDDRGYLYAQRVRLAGARVTIHVDDRVGFLIFRTVTSGQRRRSSQ